MDTFFEQIVKKKLSATDWLLYLAIWAAAGILALLCVMFASSFALILIAAIIFFSFKLSNRLLIEYEYIFTNGDLDIDKIIAKSSRKRVVAINCRNVEKYGKYTAGAESMSSVKKVYTFCDKRDEKAVYMIAPHKNEGTVMIIMAPDERLKGAIEKAIPRMAF